MSCNGPIVSIDINSGYKLTWVSHGSDYEVRPDYGGSKDLRNDGKRMPVYKTLQPKIQPCSGYLFL
jgi:hypothetical protein